ncbi:alkaline phosphatase family protein [Sutterella sp.]|uniref:alkaline phosphatase family protein n=1 Tax=Sutterella sp. TaxID=1981025 RepID=UPI0026E06F19|nr:alkaline phosphatase family protein [Sutterella sp.]MDO5530938.1 alkaline phosphatase family protein [Sutterella sp.]
MSLKFLIVGFDGLRPSDVTPETMPALSRFVAESHSWKNYLGQFPTETYVNHPSIFSGFRPGDHGIIANSFFNAAHEGEARLFQGWSVESVMRQDALERGLYRVPDLGARLAREGKTLRIYCSNSAGSTRLQNIHASQSPGHLNCCVHAMLKTLPPREAQMLARDHGDGVPLQFPDNRGTKMIVDLFFEREVPNGLGDVTFLWIGEPDHAEHAFPLSDPRVADSRRVADREFARVLDWWEAEGRAAGVQLVTISDHGIVEVARHFDVAQYLEDQGFSVITSREIMQGEKISEEDVVLVGCYAAGLWLPHRAPKRLLELRDALMASPDVGLIFSQPDDRRPVSLEGRVPGTFSEALTSSAHRRGPDLRFVTRGDPETGRIVMTDDIPLGAGMHGGLLPQETHALLAAAGSRFPGAGVHEEPASHDDFSTTLMTMLSLLDDDAPLPLPSGRILSEAMGIGAASELPTSETLTLSCGGFTQTLERMLCRGHAYITQGSRKADGWMP